MSVAGIGQQIAQRLHDDAEHLRAIWNAAAPIRHFCVDRLLPPEEVRFVYDHVPDTSRLIRRRSIRESKWAGVAVESYHPSIGEHLFAFQTPEVVSAIAAITGFEGLEPDPTLYASGISIMKRGDFLNPHLDNSHDGDQRRYRVLNLLFYVSPDWSLADGGNLELWTGDLRNPTVIESTFNRLVVMETNQKSWHSVQPVVADAPRVCLSNYYFSPIAPGGKEYRNVTSFRARPEQPLPMRWLARMDAAVLNALGRIAPVLLRLTRHRR
ncbi:MAG TPA: 2OG-Fe(II) oxygenase [Thermoanaerobaculia bacterium]|nr:2OG-Fe(II) oxygenase [Thermoanaerobaculia bacterium]